MTHQYLAGELTILLSLLEAATSDASAGARARSLRREAETRSVDGLEPVAVRALSLAEELCWHSLDRGDAAAFARLVAVSGQIQEFGVAAGMFGDDWPTSLASDLSGT